MTVHDYDLLHLGDMSDNFWGQVVVDLGAQPLPIDVVDMPLQPLLGDGGEVKATASGTISFCIRGDKRRRRFSSIAPTAKTSADAAKARAARGASAKRGESRVEVQARWLEECFGRLIRFKTHVQREAAWREAVRRRVKVKADWLHSVRKLALVLGITSTPRVRPLRDAPGRAPEQKTAAGTAVGRASAVVVPFNDEVSEAQRQRHGRAGGDALAAGAQFKVRFGAGSLGLRFQQRRPPLQGAMVLRVAPGEQAAAAGTIDVGDVVHSVGSVDCSHLEYGEIVNLLKATPRSARRRFAQRTRQIDADGSMTASRSCQLSWVTVSLRSRSAPRL